MTVLITTGCKVDQAKVRGGKVYFAFTKIGTYPQDPPEVTTTLLPKWIARSQYM